MDGKAVAGNVEALQSPLSTYVLRLCPGSEIVSSLQKLLKENYLEAAFILTCVGSVTKATLRMADSVTIKTYEGHFEIVSLVGTLSAGGHLHGSFSDKDGKVFGGHVIGDLLVYTTAEIVVGNCPLLKFEREHDDQSGYKELVVKKTSSDN
ncbi:bifunctional protein GlmU-like isoform X2 [Ruditapes philippinarum]|uniref:bifunctional protein GlmU-like isoform X2 n=1 Tax=Ruditapes philippinarum TaxID=129788 RepID=UPI00295A5844|nr:bifunctional protein GlmU-like isoform X2 [Ruditapes philippinarum]